MSRRTPPDCFLSFAEVATIIGLDEKTIRNNDCGTDELLRIKLGKRTVFSFNDVQGWIRRRIGEARGKREQGEAANLSQEKAEMLKRSRFTRETMLHLVKSLFC